MNYDGDGTIFPTWLIATVWILAFGLWGVFLDWRERRRKRRPMKRKDET